MGVQLFCILLQNLKQIWSQSTQELAFETLTYVEHKQKKLQLKKATKKLTLCPSHSWNPMGLFFLVLVCLFVFVFSRFLQLLPSAQNCQKPMEKMNKQWRSMSGWPMSTQSHLMHIIHVCIFCWFSHGVCWCSHGLGTLPESYLKPWEEMHHSRDLKIESAN